MQMVGSTTATECRVLFRIKKIRVITLAVRYIFRGYLIKIAKDSSSFGIRNTRIALLRQRARPMYGSPPHSKGPEIFLNRVIITETFFHTSKDYTLNLPCSATNTTGCFRDGGVLGKIPQNRLYALGIKILNLYPPPNYTPVGNDNFNYRTQASSQTPERNDTLRIDYNISKNWRTWGRWLNTAATSILPYGNSGLGLSTNLPDFGATQKTPKYSYSGTVTGTLNPTTVVEFTYGISHNLIDLRVSTDAATRAITGLTAFPLLYPDANYLDQIPNFTWGGRVANGPSIDTKSGSFENFNKTQ